MELSELQSPPVPAVYEKDGKALINMMVDADLLTPDFLNGIEGLSKLPSDDSISSTVSQINFFVNVLSQTIKAWDLTDKGTTIPITADFLRGRPVWLLGDLFECVSLPGQVKKRPNRHQQILSRKE
jgi:hypothetical protein